MAAVHGGAGGPLDDLSDDELRAAARALISAENYRTAMALLAELERRKREG